jgi:methanogenic corrinoid protein MtbC1
MSAYELLIDVELNEEAVKCLAISGRQTDAIKSAQEVIEKLEKSNRRDTL